MVIQRLQNLYLFIAVILMGVFCFMPYMGFVAETKAATLGVMHLTIGASVITNWFYFLLSIAVTLVVFITLMLFKKPKTQQKMAMVSAVLIVGLAVSAIAYSAFVLEQYECSTYSLRFAAGLPLLSLILIVMAIGRIKKDIRLLSSYDRFR